MTITAGQPSTLLSQWYDFAGGTLTDLDAVPTITITHIGTGAVVLAATASGVTHPGTGSYGFTWTPASSLTAGDYLVQWSGLKGAAPVNATETVTVLSPAAAEATNANLAGVWYATRENVKRALDSKETARNNGQVDRALEAASRSIEALCHRTFYPVAATRYFDWPNSQQAAPWRLWLDANELVSVAAVSSGGTSIPLGNVLLEPNLYGPPYSRLELDLGSNAAFGGGNTHQRDISVTGLYGYRDDETTVGSLTVSMDASQTSADVTGPASALLGVGSTIRVDSERMTVTARSMTSTGQTLAGSGLGAAANAVSVAVADSSGYAVDEVILIDAERMLIVDIAGTTLIVKRAWDGSVLAAHTAGATVYAPRRLTVTRGVLGTTAASHGAGQIHRWDPPGPVHALTIAETLTLLGLEQSGYARTQRVGDNAGEKTRDQRGIQGLRDQVYASHGRKARMRGV